MTHNQFSFNTESASGVIKKEVSLKVSFATGSKEFGRALGVALIVSGILPESQRLVSSPPADLADFSPESRPLSFSLCVCLTLSPLY